jgi:hypothetical protein
MNKYFITFGAGSDNYIKAGERLISQAENTKLFNEIILYTDTYLKNDIIFWNKHGTFINQNKRGYGYWLWKSYIIKKTMEKMNDNDILLYLDAGCEIDINKSKFFDYYFNLVKKDYIIGTFTCIEKEWTKMDLILKLDVNNFKYLDTQQHQGGVILFLVCDKTRKLVNEWYDLSCDYHLIDDSPSIVQNVKCFRQHRHDQSIFSLLTKKYDLYSSNRNFHNVIEIIRNKTGLSKINNNINIIFSKKIKGKLPSRINSNINKISTRKVPCIINSNTNIIKGKLPSIINSKKKNETISRKIQEKLPSKLKNNSSILKK